MAEALAHAPSVHNTRPWRLAGDGRVFELRVDARRRLTATDPDDRELRISCGAALLNVSLALAVGGRRSLVGLLPDPTSPGLVATLRPAEHMAPTPEETALHAAIPLRRSHRLPFADRPVSGSHRMLLRRAAETEGVWLHAVHEPAERRRLRALLTTAHRRQWADPGFRAEWERWTGRPDGEPYGVRADAGGAPPQHNDVWMVRDFTHGTPPADGAPAAGHDPEPLLLVIGTSTDLPTAHLRAGMALQRVLLTATALGLATSVISAPTEVRETRAALARMYGPGVHAQVLVRVGHAARPEPGPDAGTPDRPWRGPALARTGPDADRP
ncbi:hypothetical protein GCM10010210_27220 [Pseudonocardia hydrocarbonoxydans]|uniref:Nitroreductase domain-containing protein n=1 Tax=Pseudonocardia hydrocarbonoxydans TaxID=76726 RepID=A0A4Y3WRP8_9PSEU|nr:hypothetical protein PHY01_23190 [Pseudonocardia hydrocarbonoxydans]